MKVKKRIKLPVCILSCIIIIIAICGFGAWYVNDYYKADIKAIEVFASQNIISGEVREDQSIVFTPEDATTGFIFYPGGKVEHSSYVPLMQECAEQGILCVLVEMPFNLAVLDINAAEGIQKQYPQIIDWYIGGHSLGGSMAASYLEKNADNFEGLILLGSYSTADLSKTKLQALSIYGSEDGVLNHEKYDKYKGNLPEGYEEIVIDGGCHAYFGMYGNQEGDGIPTISNEEQICLTAEYISDFFKGISDYLG